MMMVMMRMMVMNDDGDVMMMMVMNDDGDDGDE